MAVLSRHFYEALAPSLDKIDRARQIIKEFEAANTVLVVIDGKLIEKSVLRAMCRTVSITDRMGLSFLIGT